MPFFEEALAPTALVPLGFGVLEIRAWFMLDRGRDSGAQNTHMLRLREYLSMFKEAAIAWIDDRAPTMGAALAFYSAFSLAPLLVIVIAVAGMIYGVDAARGAVVGQFSTLLLGGAVRWRDDGPGRARRRS